MPSKIAKHCKCNPGFKVLFTALQRAGLCNRANKFRF